MPTECISFRDTQYFSNLICDYLEENKHLKPFYGRFPNISNFKGQIEEKSQTYNNPFRTVLVNALKKQYQGIEISSQTIKNIEDLDQENTFTITTGHQLNLFTGPAYFFYKIMSTINLCNQLKSVYPNYNFVPIYWMASEDHDFEEINFFNLNQQKIQWRKQVSGAVGQLDLEGIGDVFDDFKKELPLGDKATALENLFKDAYLKHSSLTDATRYLVNALFSHLGLVIFDGDHKKLKKLFVPFMRDELLKQTAFKQVIETNSQINSLPENYKIQVTPREINLFYIISGVRERIVENEGQFTVLNTDYSWNQNELIEELQQHPERFSPNVIMRPLYQEVILPNLCYIGGGGELAYWFQLKSNFKSNDITFPILLLRNSVLVTTKKQRIKLQKLKVPITDLFLSKADLFSKITKKQSQINIDFSPQKEHLKKQFKDLYALAKQTDKSFIGAVAAQERKQIKGLEHLEKRLLKAQKRKHADYLDRVSDLQDQLFPKGTLQERHANFSEFYLRYGDQFIQQLALNLQPLKGEFVILNLD